MTTYTYYERSAGMDRTKLLAITKCGRKYRVLYDMVSSHRAYILPVSELSKYEILWIIHHLKEETKHGIF